MAMKFHSSHGPDLRRAFAELGRALLDVTKHNQLGPWESEPVQDDFNKFDWVPCAPHSPVVVARIGLLC